ncbi:hypothetical protein GCM10027053_52160 [Intrasporangium mesophilum]
MTMLEPPSASKAFLAQNAAFAAGLTAEGLEAIEAFAEHHSGGLYVLGRQVSDELYVKTHDSWGPGMPDEPGDVVVHLYSLDDEQSLDLVLFFNDGTAALAAFFAVDESTDGSDAYGALGVEDYSSEVSNG